MLGQSEPLLWNQKFQRVTNNERWGDVLADRDGGEQLVVCVPASLRDALAEADEPHLASVERPWPRIDEFWGAEDPDLLEDALIRAKGHAMRARASSPARLLVGAV